MRITFYGRLGERIGREIDVAPSAGTETIGALRAMLVGLYPEASHDLDREVSRAAVDDRIVDDDFPLAGAGAVEFFPPLSGG